MTDTANRLTQGKSCFRSLTETVRLLTLLHPKTHCWYRDSLLWAEMVLNKLWLWWTREVLTHNVVELHKWNFESYVNHFNSQIQGLKGLHWEWVTHGTRRLRTWLHRWTCEEFNWLSPQVEIYKYMSVFFMKF